MAAEIEILNFLMLMNHFFIITKIKQNMDLGDCVKLKENNYVKEYTRIWIGLNYEGIHQILNTFVISLFWNVSLNHYEMKLFKILK